MNELSLYLKGNKGKAAALISALYKARELYGEVGMDALREAADGLDIPFSQAAGVATFYSAFNGMDDGEADGRFLADTGDGGRPAWFMRHPAGYQAVRKFLTEQIDLIDWMRQARLRGRSGSGFPMADKWELTAGTPGTVKYIVCNGNEGEGDTYKDYLLLTMKPELVIEGMVLCALATGIPQGYLCIRAEYAQAYHAVCDSIQNAYADGVLGENVLGSGKQFELEAVLGGGAYVTGEETGLLEMLEGRRGEPRLKPPFPGVSGLQGKPTIVNNAESFASAAVLVLQGVEACQAAGTEETGGTKLYTVSGAVKRLGVYELPHHATAADALKAAGGTAGDRAPKGFQLGGGATGSFGSSDLFDTVLDYGPAKAAGLALGTAAIRLIGEDESVPALALESTEFLCGQSCGLCTACRGGLSELRDTLACLCDGKGTARTLDELKELCDYISQTARCALGQAAPTAVHTALRAFPEEFERLCREEDTDVYFL